MSAMMMIEARRSERIRSFLRARILFNNGASTIDCVVKNISTHGAKLDLPNTVSVPAQFELEVPQRGRSYRCRMMWRSAEAIGIEFIEAGAPSEDAQGTIKRLEAENRKLRASVGQLTKRLEDLGQAIEFN